MANPVYSSESLSKISSSGSLVNSIVTSPKSGQSPPEFVPSGGAPSTTWVQKHHPSEYLSTPESPPRKSEDDEHGEPSLHGIISAVHVDEPPRDVNAMNITPRKTVTSQLLFVNGANSSMYPPPLVPHRSHSYQHLRSTSHDEMQFSKVNKMFTHLPQSQRPEVVSLREQYSADESAFHALHTHPPEEPP
eukprot:CAMPEP_0118922240 /NCGR_PEP_ID=MMETSP1169-20130426/1231_1 /TAXON_ID=36882 /ORGANISM="Pyramimonas obovata, Strain CCMP722" /LENGTH=189 /DNA_ID=CAMNT_0006863071 /DNA_START=562 /DNA_END=1127 /DNA_ORIENTATION=+